MMTGIPRRSMEDHIITHVITPSPRGRCTFNLDILKLGAQYTRHNLNVNARVVKLQRCISLFIVFINWLLTCCCWGISLHSKHIAIIVLVGITPVV